MQAQQVRRWPGSTLPVVEVMRWSGCYDLL